MGFISGIKKFIFGFSFGLVLLLILGFMYIRPEAFFLGEAGEWRDQLLIPLVFLTLFFSFDSLSSIRTGQPLFKLPFITEFLRFLIFGVLGFIGFFILGFIVKGNALPTIAEALSNIPIWSIALYSFCVCIPEELIFRGRVENELKSRRFPRALVILSSSVIFALYHAFLGKSFFTLLFYIPLGILFSLIKEKFSPDSHMANAGVHFAWNMWFLGFMT